MPGLIQGLAGMTTQQRSGTESAGQRGPLPQQKLLFDVLTRNLLGPQVTLPDIPLSTPLLQGISGLQDVAQPLLNRALGPESRQGTAARLAAGAGPPVAGTSGIPPGPGVPEFGRTQTREELGIPHRAENFPFTPTEEEIRTIGLPKVRTTPRAARGMAHIEKLKGRQEKLEAKIEKREGRGKPTKGQEKKLKRVGEKLERKRAQFE